MSRNSAFLHQMMQCAARFSYGAGFQECGGRLAGQAIKGKLAEDLNKSHQFVRTEGTVSVFGAWNGGLARGKDGVESKAVLLHQGSYSSQMMAVVCGRAALVVEAKLNGDIERRADWLGDMVVKPEHVRCASLPAIVPQWPTSAWKAVAVTQVRTAAIAWGFGSSPALSNRIMGASVLDANHIRAQTRSLAYGKMANRSIRDQNKRRLVEKYEMKRAHYKAVFHDRSLPSQVRYDFFQRLSKLPRSSSKTRLKNRCVFTGRSHSVFRKFGISRIVFRELARRGDLTGVYKASW